VECVCVVVACLSHIPWHAIFVYSARQPGNITVTQTHTPYTHTNQRRLEHNSCFWLFRRVACDLRFVPPKRERDRKRVWEQMQTIIEIYYDYCTPVECSLQYAMCNMQRTMYNVQTAIWQRCTDSPKSLKCGNTGKGIWNGTKMKLMRTERLVEILFSESTFKDLS